MFRGNNPKICFVSLRPSYRFSGQTESMNNFISNLADRYGDVYIWGHSGIRQFNKTVDLNSDKFKRSRWRDVIFVKELIRFLKYLKNHPNMFDLIYLQLPTPAFSIIADIIKGKSGAKIIVHFDSIAIDKSILEILRISCRYDFFYYFFRLLVNNKYLARRFSKFKADHYVVASRYQREQLIKEFHLLTDKISIIPNFVSSKKKKAFLLDKDKAREFFGFKKSDFIITYIGHVLHHKGIYDLAKIFSQLQSDNRYKNNLKLVIASSGESNLRKIKKMYQNIIYLNEVNIVHLLSATDILCLPYVFSFSTNFFPSALLEGLEAEVPIITTDLPLTREILNRGIIKGLARPGDIDDLKNKITGLIDSKDFREKLILDQKKCYAEAISEEGSMEKLINLYNQVLNYGK